MSRVMTLALIVALLSSVALADVEVPGWLTTGVLQTQGQATGITNVVSLQHGSYGTNTAAVDIKNMQNVLGACNLVAKQNQIGFLMGTASACADCGLVDVIQGIGTIGNQVQMVGGGSGPIVQSESMTLEGVQGINKTEGLGNGNALQAGMVSQDQTAINANATVRESSRINAIQASSLVGAPGTSGVVGSTVEATTTQLQMVY
ncbi:hypothetical protein ACFL6U_11235 [Planctomycetota bacterium]